MNWNKAFSRLWHNRVCGCHQEEQQRLREGWVRLTFFLTSAAALAWFLVRVIPKPIRATYPCQRAAFPLATTFVIWLLGLKTGLVAWLNLKNRLVGFRPVLIAAGILCLLALTALTASTAVKRLSLSSGLQSSWAPADPPNSPIGAARGIFAGRVVWMRDTNAAPWDGVTGHWWTDNTGVKQAAVERMISTSLQALTGATNDIAAWDKLFHFYNSTHGRGDLGYAANETIAMKINCNNSYSGYGDVDEHIDASPQSVLAMLRQLVNKAGVPQDRITVYEAVRVVPDRIYNPCHAEFPNVVWLDSQGNGSNGRQPPNFHANAFNYSTNNTGCGNSIPEAVYQATYLLNMAVLKGHWRAGVSLTGKNHFGTINTPAHIYTQAYGLPMGAYSPFVDLIGSRLLGGKTLLFMIDGLYGVLEVESYVNSSTGGWANLFGGGWSSSCFMSLDPLAIDSVGLDFLRSEFGDRLATGHSTNCDNYLHEAAQLPNPPSGTIYRPDGTTLTSLGVHEHWNNATNKQYSRNLGATNGIELIKIEASTRPAVAIVNPPGGAILTAGTNIPIQVVVADGASTVRQVRFYGNGTLLATTTNSPYPMLWTNTAPGNWSLTAVATDANNNSSTSAVVAVTIQTAPAGPPTISRMVITNGTVALTFQTSTGRTYRVERTESPRPVAWTSPVPSQTATGSSLTILDTTGVSTQRFYRAVLLP